MNAYPPDVQALLVALRVRLVDSGMPASIARLYAQFSRLRERQRPLPSWTDAEAAQRFDEALQLVDAALDARTRDEPTWRASARRAAELLEWLAQPGVYTTSAPLHLLSAAVYQLAGYPARALGLLYTWPDAGESRILHAFLRGDFVALLDELGSYWSLVADESRVGVGVVDAPAELAALPRQITRDVAGAIGLLCAALRWGDDSRIDRAIINLDAIARLMRHSRDPYSALLGQLCAESMRVYTQSALRAQSTSLRVLLGPNGNIALERYLRLAFASNRALTWPSQLRGIARLAEDRSFVLCTPTGSGKTTIAELAIILRLFAPDRGGETEQYGPFDQPPLVIYLVPSRALAAEVEAKLARIVRHFVNPAIRVTALYGGTDFGPTDVWLTANERVVVIATYEKGEALLRFLGARLLQRLALVVIDEAHGVQYEGHLAAHEFAENRALRLEALTARLLTRMDPNQQRVIALSAVAGGIEQALAAWVAGDETAQAEIVTYRSTRQIIGRLECLPDRTFEIRYDLLDGSPLQVGSTEFRDSPYIRDPFTSHPPAPAWLELQRADLRLIPAVLWAAMQFAAGEGQQQRTVLVSILEDPERYARDFLTLLDDVWARVQRPAFFQPPDEPDAQQLWATCLRACEDYFGRDSYEYRLLTHGIVLHHGKMPGSLARLLIRVIERGIVHIVAATSTLTEGINTPVSLVLITSLRRYNANMPVQEFVNLAGRAGRPGYTTEGRVLVVLERGPVPQAYAYAVRQSLTRYQQMIVEIQRRGQGAADRAASALASLLNGIEQLWQRESGIRDRQAFLIWLEQTAPIDLHAAAVTEDLRNLATALDTLDSVLLAVAVEVEELQRGERVVDNLEQELQRVWQRTYARYAAAEEDRLAAMFVRRGQALVQTIYPDRAYRRRLYRTALAPLSGAAMLNTYPRLREHLATGEDYADWSPAERLAYITTVINLLSTIPMFTPPPRAGRRNVIYAEVLAWWLSPRTARRLPRVEECSSWHRYVSQVFSYRVNWGLGSVLGLILEDSFGEYMGEPSLERWPQTGLPWIVYWLKELLTWGTLDPVVAYLLALGYAQTRPDAEELAVLYHQLQQTAPPELRLSAVTIRDWCATLPRLGGDLERQMPPLRITVTLRRRVDHVVQRPWHVLPVVRARQLLWFDPAGYILAESTLPEVWLESFRNRYDFVLDLDSRTVIWGNYVETNIPLSPHT